MNKMLAVGLLLAGCNQSPAPPGQSALTAAMFVGASAADLVAGGQPAQFVFSSQRELWVRVQLPNIPDLAHVNVALTLPSGAPAAAATSVFAKDPTVTWTPDNTTPVIPATAIPQSLGGPGWQMDITIPIAGTVVGRASQPEAMWGVSSTVDGVPGMLTASLDVIY